MLTLYFYILNHVGNLFYIINPKIFLEKVWKNALVLIIVGNILKRTILWNILELKI